MMLSRLAAPSATDRTTRIGWDECPCPLCGCESAPVVREGQDPNTVNGLIFSVVRCPQCQLHYTNPRPDEASIGRFYPDDYKPHHRTRKNNRTVDRSFFNWLTGSDCPERRGELPFKGPGKLLDFGCGGGTFLKRMSDLGWEVTGLDAASGAVQRIRNDLRLPAHLGTLPHPDLAAASFDVITMWHSLEHVHDPMAVLRAAFKLLAPGGQLIVAVPNIDSWPARYFGSDWFGLDLPRHLTHFDPKSLKEMLLLAGYKVTNVKLVKHSDWLRSSALLAKRRGRGTTLKHLLTWKPLAKLAAWLMYMTGQCDCLMAVVERPGTN
ncbi:class I SAM-dependent methyltransferase [soil metagenome]